MKEITDQTDNKKSRLYCKGMLCALLALVPVPVSQAIPATIVVSEESNTISVTQVVSNKTEYVIIPPLPNADVDGAIHINAVAAKGWTIVEQYKTVGWEPYWHLNYTGDRPGQTYDYKFEGKVERDPPLPPTSGGGGSPDNEFTINAEGSFSAPEYYITPRPEYIVCAGKEAKFAAWRSIDGKKVEEPSDWIFALDEYAASVSSVSIATNVANVYKVKAHSSENPALTDEVEMKVVKVKIESSTPENIVCVGGTKSYTAVVTPSSVASEGTFSWSVNNPSKLGFVDGDTSSQTITVTGLVHSAGLLDEELKVTFTAGDAVCQPTTNLTVVSVEFDEADENTDNYGWDDYSMTLDWEFKSVEVGGSDDVSAVVAPHGAYEMISYQSTVPARVSVAPDTASASDLITVEGLSENSSTIIAKSGDYEIAKFKTFAYTKPDTIKVAVTRVHEKGGDGDSGYFSTVSISEVEIEEKLKKVFKQAVVEFDVEILPPRTVSFDLNHDGKLGTTNESGGLDVNNPECVAIKEACETVHEYNIFLVSRPDWTGEPGEALGGMMEKPGKFGFVFHSSATTLAHELGHGHGSLDHTFDDIENIMSYGPSSRWRLRRVQWDLCNY